jgi:hypothetical protein
VDAVSALPDDARDFSEPRFAGVINFERTASHEAEVTDREHNGVKEWFVRVVERAIDKTSLLRRRACTRPSLETLSDNGGHRSFDCLCPEIALLRGLLHRRQPVNFSPTDGTIATVHDNLTRR